MRTIDDVILHMKEIDATLSVNDGVAWFNKLYLRTTQEVAAAHKAGRFEDSAFMEALDVVFAGYFFTAYERWVTGQSDVPRAWAPLFEVRHRERVAPLQFALAGMNAHINRDLATSLVDTCEEMGRAPERGTPWHRDYLIINDILQKTEAEVKAWFSTGFIGVIDDAMGQADDVAALWSVAHARDAAWMNAEMLWAMRGSPQAAAAYLTTLDRFVGFAGRAMLLPRIVGS